MYRHIWGQPLTQNFSVTSTAVENTCKRRLDPLSFHGLAHLCKDTMEIWMRNPFILCTTIAKRAYVLLAAWFPTRGAQCCRGRVRFSCTASTWWVWQWAPERSGFSNLSHFIEGALVANHSFHMDVFCDVTDPFVCSSNLLLWDQWDVSLTC